MMAVGCEMELLESEVDDCSVTALAMKAYEVKLSSGEFIH